VLTCPLDLASACMLDTITWQRSHTKVNQGHIKVIRRLQTKVQY
jgi:hypothetical protein